MGDRREILCRARLAVGGLVVSSLVNAGCAQQPEISPVQAAILPPIEETPALVMPSPTRPKSEFIVETRPGETRLIEKESSSVRAKPGKKPEPTSVTWEGLQTIAEKELPQLQRFLEDKEIPGAVKVGKPRIAENIGTSRIAVPEGLNIRKLPSEEAEATFALTHNTRISYLLDFTTVDNNGNRITWLALRYVTPEDKPGDPYSFHFIAVKKTKPNGEIETYIKPITNTPEPTAQPSNQPSMPTKNEQLLAQFTRTPTEGGIKPATSTNLR
ncbi:MAG: hypothetical protein C4584_02870 [Armatimonadetes bacterium]|nr:MAG: hypothetical protein C4584_02870 [Armatimonadota bacterium]